MDINNVLNQKVLIYEENLLKGGKEFG